MFRESGVFGRVPFFFHLSSEWVHQALLQLVLLVACTFHTHGRSVCMKENMNRLN